MGSTGTLRLFDTTELYKPTPRKLHAAWAEIHGRRLTVSPTVAWELAGDRWVTIDAQGTTDARDYLKRKRDEIDEETERRLMVQDWWGRVWWDPTSPYVRMPLKRHQKALTEKLANEIDPTCFRNAKPGYVSEHRDTLIICEALALGATVLLTSNMRSIDHERVNAWAISNGHRLGFRPVPVLYEADNMLMTWTKRRRDRELWLEAGLIACWPPRDDAPAEEVLHQTVHQIEGMASGTGGRLRNSGQRLLEGLRNHRNPERLVEQARARLPSSTVVTDRNHPMYTTRPDTAGQATAANQESAKWKG